MKCSLVEYENEMQILIEPETVKETAQLVRLGMMTKKGTETVVTAYGSGEIQGVVHYTKKHNASGTIPNR